MKKLVIILALAAFVAVILPHGAFAAVKVGILAKRGAPQCMEKWGDLGAYLSAQIGDEVQIVPLKFEAIEPAVAGGKVDFVLANSAFYVELEKKLGVKAVATMVNSLKGKPMSEFGGVILVKADSPIQNLEDIRGKKFMVVKKSSFGGGQMAVRLLKENGIDPQNDCAEYLEGNKHDNVVLAVQSGACDAGTVRTDTLERMADEGKINLAEFRVINKIEDSFPFLHSTQLYPEWPMAACSGTDPAVVTKVVAALKALKADDPAAKSAKIVGWSDPADYGPVRECLTIIGYGAFAAIQ